MQIPRRLLQGLLPFKAVAYATIQIYCQGSFGLCEENLKIL
jgi:hypothetical protein